MSLKDKSGVVAGASRGLGLGLTQVLVEQGAR
jgi:NAD(P)-dependent dehydrogenase (short-subunit alcohol dehydrogenase family)